MLVQSQMYLDGSMACQHPLKSILHPTGCTLADRMVEHTTTDRKGSASHPTWTSYLPDDLIHQLPERGIGRICESWWRGGLCTGHELHSRSSSLPLAFERGGTQSDGATHAGSRLQEDPTKRSSNEPSGLTTLRLWAQASSFRFVCPSGELGRAGWGLYHELVLLYAGHLRPTCQYASHNRQIFAQPVHGAQWDHPHLTYLPQEHPLGAVWPFLDDGFFGTADCPSGGTDKLVRIGGSQWPPATATTAHLIYYLHITLKLWLRSDHPLAPYP